MTFVLYSCFRGDGYSSYSDFTCAEIQEAEYNVYFFFPDKRDKYLVSVHGLNACGKLAWNYASEKDFARGDGWSYICCMIAKDSQCYEKHR